MFSRILGLTAKCCALALLATPAHAQGADFFRDKQVSLYVGFAPGGGYDTYARLLSRFLGPHIPGNPKIVVQHRPGAGGVVLGNDLYNTLPKDGTAVATFSNSLHLWETLGQANIRFVSSRFNWIGRVTDADDVMAVRPASGVTKFADVKQRSITIGVPGAGSSPALMVGALNAVLGTKFTIISGYRGSSEIRLAVERGELDGNQSLLWSVDHEWVKANNLRVLYRVSSSDIDGLKDVPTLIQLAETPEQKKLIAFFTSYTDVGRPLVAPPDVPKDRVAVLRKAFDDAMKDPEFVDEMKRLDLRLSPMTGEKLQALVESAGDLNDDLKRTARIAAGLEEASAR